MRPPFVHLHTHSHYSLLDGLSKVNEMVALAKKYGMPAIGLTDHGNMYGAIEFYKECKAAKIKPIIGVEAYIANRTRFDKEPSIDNKRYHLTLLAKNKTGYENLIKLVTASHLEGYYYKPRMDLDVLKTHSEGLICLSGCFGSELSHALRNKNEKEAIHVAETYRDIFGEENYFFEIMHHPGVPGLMDVRAATVELGKKLAPNIFLGVYPCDISPNTNNKPVFAVIFNLSKHNEEGTHYVAIFVTQNSVTYFDSFGKKCTNSDIKKFILPHKVNKKFISNSIQVQHDESNFCGFFSLAFILSQVLNISLKKFLKL
ncbi:MAG: DNA polymerase III subunit alpha, partial [Parcubacteria group bacterium Gr01-1014_48]